MSELRHKIFAILLSSHSNEIKAKLLESYFTELDKKLYSEEEIHLILGSFSEHNVAFSHEYTYDMWFEQFKKK